MDVAGSLGSLGLEEYAPAFQKNDIGCDLLLHLTADDLKDIGITSVGHRRRLLEAIATLRASTAPSRDGSRETPGSAPARDDRGSIQPDAERRQITVMFCHLVGSTAFSARPHPRESPQLHRPDHAR